MQHKTKALNLINAHYEQGDSVFVVVVKDSGPLHSFTFGNDETRVVAIGAIIEDSFQDAVSHGGSVEGVLDSVNAVISNVAAQFIQHDHSNKGRRN